MAGMGLHTVTVDTSVWFPVPGVHMYWECCALSSRKRIRIVHKVGLIPGNSSPWHGVHHTWTEKVPGTVSPLWGIPQALAPWTSVLQQQVLKLSASVTYFVVQINTVGNNVVYATSVNWESIVVLTTWLYALKSIYMQTQTTYCSCHVSGATEFIHNILISFAIFVQLYLDGLYTWDLDTFCSVSFEWRLWITYFSMKNVLYWGIWCQRWFI